MLGTHKQLRPVYLSSKALPSGHYEGDHPAYKPANLPVLWMVWIVTP